MVEIDWDRLGKRGALVVLVICAAFLAGCARFTDTVTVPPGSLEYELYGDRTIGQTVTCYHAGLNGVGVLAKAGAGELILHLRDASSRADSTPDVATVAISPPPSGEAVFLQFEIPLQDDVNGESFFLLLEAPSATDDAPFVLLYDLNVASQYDLLLSGADATPGHLSFQLHYSYLHIVKDLVRQAASFGLETLWLLFLSALFYLLPGGAAVAWLLREGDWIERVIVALGLSVAIHALVMYATMTGLRLSSAVVIGFLALCAALIGVRWWLDRREGRLRIPLAKDIWASVKRDPSPVALAFVFALVLGVRIWVTRGMIAPRWGDSYQHTVIAQLMVDNGGLFESWEPYAPYAGLTTHFGFSANAAIFHWVSGTGVVRSVIWVGQIINALACLALYPLGNRAGGRWAGVISVLVCGLLMPTPMIYVNWGRYPQLMGQVILPVAAWLFWTLLDRPGFDWRLVVLNVVATLGQVFAYYRMPYYFGLLAGALLFCMFIPKFKLQWRHWKRLLLLGLAVGVPAVMLFVPWGLHVARGRLGTMFVQGVSVGMQVDHVLDQFRLWLSLGTYVPKPLLVVAGAAVLWAALSRDATPMAFGLWAAGLPVLNAARLVGVPGAAFLDAFASMIQMYAPASLLIGWLGATIATTASQRLGRWVYGLFAALVAVSVLGAYGVSTTSDPGYDLVKASDMEAMAWIRTSTPPESRFLVNGFQIYSGRSVVGSDAGWWIPLLAQRENTMPPQYALLTARETDEGYKQRMLELVSGLRQTPISTPEGLSLVCQNGITHVYVGQGEGRVAQPPSIPLFTVEEMLSSPMFESLYHRDRVWVWKLADAACQPVAE